MKSKMFKNTSLQRSTHKISMAHIHTKYQWLTGLLICKNEEKISLHIVQNIIWNKCTTITV